MQYLIVFLEGIITFVSPCLLPMLPIYISYFAGGKDEFNKKKALINSFGFVAGFSVVFVILGAFAGSAGKILREYNTFFNVLSGLIVIIFGLNYIGIIKLKALNSERRIGFKVNKLGFVSSALFGVVFSIGWTPCVGAFLGSALVLAGQQGSVIQGIIMLLCFSIGLGIPFIASALLIERLKATFDFIKRNYKVINTISGIFLILIGILMMTGMMASFMSLLTF